MRISIADSDPVRGSHAPPDSSADAIFLLIFPFLHRFLELLTIFQNSVVRNNGFVLVSQIYR